MNCDREELLIDAAHLQSCDDCLERLAVAAAIAREHHDAMRDAPIPTSDAMWSRVRRRWRRETLRMLSAVLT